MSWKIYLIKHLDTDMKYVGITGGDLRTRWEQHRADTNSGVYKALRTEGYRMTMEEIEEVATKPEALKREQELIRSLGTATPNGYNRQVTTIKEVQKEVQHSNASSTDKMFKNGKRQSLFARKNEWSKWIFDSTAIYDNCKIDSTNFSYFYPSYGRLVFADDNNTKNGIWCTAPRPHVLDYYFECAALDKYFLVSFNDMFNPFNKLNPRTRNPITYTLHSCLWYDDLKNPNAKWRYEGTYLTKVYMNDFKHEHKLEEVLVRYIQQHKVVDEITLSNWSKTRKVEWNPITEYNECNVMTEVDLRRKGQRV
jgi:predicted GIY-YIG superfamily endonuclease